MPNTNSYFMGGNIMKFKKATTILLAAAMTLGLAACGGSKSADTKKEDKKASSDSLPSVSPTVLRTHLSLQT